MGTKQLKNNAVTGAKIKNGAVTASKINTSGLTVPNTTHAAKADSATNATNANNATNISKLGGLSAIHWKLGFCTNSAYATYCPGAESCGWRPELVDDSNGDILDDAIWRPRTDSAANTISLDAVVAAPAQTTRTYTMKLWYENDFAEGDFTLYDYSLAAETFPFGSTGGSTLASHHNAPGQASTAH